MKKNAILTAAMLALAAARPDLSWGKIGFGAGQSMDPGEALKEARAGQPPRSAAPAAPGSRAAQAPPAPAWLRYAPAPLARAAAACPQVDPIVIGGTQGYADSLGSGQCFVSIHPSDTPDLIYRAYAFFSSGLMMVFSSYGDGEDNPNLTSAREFFFFPRKGVPQLAMDPQAGTVSVRLGDGGRADFDPPSAQLSGFERGTVTVSPRIDPAERGGVEIPSYDGLLLDAGFRVGESPSGLPDAASTFRDAQGRRCTVKNREFFAYLPGGDHAFKFTDAQLSAWLRTACPGLDAGF